VDHRRGGHRPRSPAVPKMAMFSGDQGEWESFFFQFRQTARDFGWPDREKRRRLMACLRGKAVEFVKSKSERTRNDYRRLARALQKCYSAKDPPRTVLNQLDGIKRGETESLEDFADLIQRKVVEAFPDATENVTNRLGVDYFLKGCRERQAAVVTMGKDPVTIQKALVELKGEMHRQRAIYGKSVTFSTRQLKWEEEPEDDSKSIRTIGKSPGEQSNSKFVTKDDLNSFASELTKKLVQVMRDRSVSPGRSPARGDSDVKCFECGKVGHMKRDCPN